MKEIKQQGVGGPFRVDEFLGCYVCAACAKKVAGLYRWKAYWYCADCLPKVKGHKIPPLNPGLQAQCAVVEPEVVPEAHPLRLRLIRRD